MPIYTYTCVDCNDVIEKRQSFSDPPLTTCEQCGGALRKVIHPVGIVFKGSGWYVTDSRSSSNGTSAAPAKKDDTSKTDKSASTTTSTSATASSTPSTTTKD